MCGRFTRHEPPQRWARELGADASPAAIAALAERDDGPRCNIPPGTRAWVAAPDADGELAFDQHPWTFPTPRGNRINVRSESAHVVPEYREHFDRRRCVVLASGFYDPAGDKAAKDRPWYNFTRADHAPLFIVAIAKSEGFSILTRAPVAPVSLVHDRMPVLIAADDVLAWPDPALRRREAAAADGVPLLRTIERVTIERVQTWCQERTRTHATRLAWRGFHPVPSA